METDRNRTIIKRKMRILSCMREKKRLRAIICFSQSPARKTQAAADLAILIKEIDAATKELEKLETEES